MELLNQRSTSACVDALLSVCEIPPTPRDFGAVFGGMAPPANVYAGHYPPAAAHGPAGSSSTSMPSSPLANASALFGGGGDLHASLPRLNISSPQKSYGHSGAATATAAASGLSVHRQSAGFSPMSASYSQGNLSTPRKRKAEEAAAALADVLEASPSTRFAPAPAACLAPGSPATFHTAMLERMHESERAALCRAALGITDDMIISPRVMGGLPRNMPSPRRRKTGPPSSRDKVWDLLTAGEKEQILADQMSAAEGTKALLERRASQLGVAVAAMPDDDDWEIGFKLTECKATSEPLAKPKTCSICLRCANHPSAACQALSRRVAATVRLVARLARVRAGRLPRGWRVARLKSEHCVCRFIECVAAGKAWSSIGTATTAAAVPSSTERSIARRQPSKARAASSCSIRRDVNTRR